MLSQVENASDVSPQRLSSKINMNITSQQFVNEKRGKISKDYEILQVIGKGAFGEVKKVIHKLTGDIRAMKIIKKDKVDEAYLRSLNTEISILKQLDHPNIVKLYEIYQDTKNIYLITEFLGGGELFDLILKTKHFNENIAARIMKQVFSAVGYCHSKNIVHRDMKPENLLLENPESFDIKIIDFGLARTYSADKMMCQRMGTPYYIAPEVLRKKYNEKCDIWSCGVILYILLSGNFHIIPHNRHTTFPRSQRRRNLQKYQPWLFPLPRQRMAQYFNRGARFHQKASHGRYR